MTGTTNTGLYMLAACLVVGALVALAQPPSQSISRQRKAAGMAKSGLPTATTFATDGAKRLTSL